jgi:epoxyqueuosine reductase
VILPGVQSILTLALLYSSPIEQPANWSQAAEIRGRVAAYAWGDDYHTIIPPRLDRLADKISDLVHKQVHQRRYTDTGPVLERDFAQQSGLGWTGKNTCLISPEAGSFFFLAELFLDLEIEPDLPFPYDRCGSCQRCIQACPTGCILPDRTIDSRRCISYLTIEAKGPIPPELRSKTGQWIFGCDICQEVCPWNIRFAPKTGYPDFAPRPGIPQPRLLNELQLTSEAFTHKFRSSPIQRARRRGYLRNVCVALGNQPDEESVSGLANILQAEPEALVRMHAAWALRQIRSKRARKELEKALKMERNMDVIEEIKRDLAD